MLRQEYEIMYKVEETHWWFAAKRRIVFDHLRRHLPAGARPRILDVGCGTGIVLAEHARIGNAYGMDIRTDALRAAAQRRAGPLVCASVVALPFHPETFDVVTCLDVLYHQYVTDDGAALAEIFHALKPGGLLIVTDSALRCLHGKHDLAVQTARRYHRPELAALLSGVGFEIVKISYMNFLLLPLVFLSRKISGLKSGPPRSNVGPVRPV